MEKRPLGELLTGFARVRAAQLDNAVTTMRLDARLGSIGQSLGTAAVLWDGREGFCFPLARVGKYLENGAEDSVGVF